MIQVGSRDRCEKMKQLIQFCVVIANV